MPAVAYKKAEVKKIISLLPYKQQVEIADEIIEKEKLRLIEELESAYHPDDYMPMDEIVAFTKRVRKKHNECKK